MPELGVASAQGLHLATLDGFTYPTDIEASARWYVDDVIAPGIEIDARGYIQLPAGPGTGYRVMREKVERYSVATATFASEIMNKPWAKLRLAQPRCLAKSARVERSGTPGSQQRRRRARETGDSRFIISTLQGNPEAAP